jgi:hypothetical protein
VNEVRAGEQLPPVEELPEGPGWQINQPVNLAAIGSDRTGTAPDGAGRPEDGRMPEPGVASPKPNGAAH